MSTRSADKQAMWKRETREVRRPDPVEILVDGRAIPAHPGENVATALLSAGISTFRYSPRGGFPRAAFCMMGSCQECVVRIDGKQMPACQASVEAGLEIETGDRPNG